jgi:hypothetical protein
MIGLDIHQSVTPGEYAPQYHHNQSGGIMRPAWPHLPLLKRRELFSQEHVLSGQSAARPENDHD